jgi:hypothetical protein
MTVLQRPTHRASGRTPGDPLCQAPLAERVFQAGEATPGEFAPAVGAPDDPLEHVPSGARGEP